MSRAVLYCCCSSSPLSHVAMFASLCLSFPRGRWLESWGTCIHSLIAGAVFAMQATVPGALPA